VNIVKEDDARLVQSTLAGNLDDFRKLVEKYRLAAERWAFHHVQNLSDAEDIAQEALVEAYFPGLLPGGRKPPLYRFQLEMISSGVQKSLLLRGRRQRPPHSKSTISN
jgi:hypothetical protein